MRAGFQHVHQKGARPHAACGCFARGRTKGHRCSPSLCPRSSCHCSLPPQQVKGLNFHVPSAGDTAPQPRHRVSLQILAARTPAQSQAWTVLLRVIFPRKGDSHRISKKCGELPESNGMASLSGHFKVCRLPQLQGQKGSFIELISGATALQICCGFLGTKQLLRQRAVGTY